MLRILTLALVLVACTDHKSTTDDPVLSGDGCAVGSDETSCSAQSGCEWLGTGCACPPNDTSCTCPPGYCVSTSGGSGAGSGSGHEACACPGSEVCFEQVGGTAQPQGSGPTIACILPADGTGDPCARIQGEGTCTDSASVSGLCVCDNGIR